MTKQKRFVFVMLALTAAVLLLVSPAAAKPAVIKFTGSHTSATATADGEVTVVGEIGQRRNGIVELDVESDEWRWSGHFTRVVNGDMVLADVHGPMWGTFTMVPAEQPADLGCDKNPGSWEGTYTGYFYTKAGPLLFRDAGEGKGCLEGQKVWVTMFTHLYPPDAEHPAGWVGNIFDPNGG